MKKSFLISGIFKHQAARIMRKLFSHFVICYLQNKAFGTKETFWHLQNNSKQSSIFQTLYLPFPSKSCFISCSKFGSRIDRLINTYETLNISMGSSGASTLIWKSFPSLYATEPLIIEDVNMEELTKIPVSTKCELTPIWPDTSTTALEKE